MLKRGIVTTLVVICLISFSGNNSAFGDVPPDVKAQLVEEKASAKLSTQISSGGTRSDSHNYVSTKKYGPTYWATDFQPVKRKVFTGFLFSQKEVESDACNTKTFDQKYMTLGEQLTGGPPGYVDGKTPFESWWVWFTGRDVNDGRILKKTEINRYTKEVLRTAHECVIPTEDPKLPPKKYGPAPTYDDVWQGIYDVTFIDDAVNNGAFILPVGSGLTGIDSKFWMDFAGGQTIQRIVNINGYTIASTATITNVQIIAKSPKGKETVLGNYAPDGSGKIPASSYENPAAKYKFKSTGMYTITTAISWEANANIRIPSGIQILVPIGVLRIDVNRQYLVNELRAGLTQ